jgi:hypothetical protein
MQKKIIEYMVATNKEENIEKVVNDLIKEGWQPLGGLFVFYQNTLIQSMVKYED